MALHKEHLSMAKTPSNMLPLGTRAPDFTLPDVVSEKLFHLYENKAPIATVIMFICNHCPFVIHIQTVLAEIAKTYQARGIQFVAINSNDIVHYPDDAPARMVEVATHAGYVFPYLFDETQDVAKAYQAACTPDFYVFDAARKCVYRGQFDDSRPGNAIPVTGCDLTAALDHILAGTTISAQQKPSLGCNIKWK
jgi:thiol-disulfide isomerase/thioredoxin